VNHWKPIAAVGVCVAVVGAAVTISIAGADTAPSSLVAITPCRLLDTRSGSEVGDHPGPLTSGETATLGVTGSHGDCTIPPSSTAVVANVTIVNPAAVGYLIVFPADAPQPVSSNLNWIAHQDATPNQVTVGLSASGEIKVFNAGGGGKVDVIIDLVGHYQAGGGTGPAPSAGNWGVINRNTIGSPVAELRSGPFTPAVGPVQASGPPFGTGSLNLTVGSDTEKAAFGNEVDFFGNLFGDLNAVGFRVFNVGENLPPHPAAMPSISIEINPHLAAHPTDVFSTLNYVAPVSLPGWSDYIDATTTGVWGGTGAAFAGTPCDINGSLCSWTDLQAMLNDGGDPATVLSVAITKGRDQEWHGAVDGLRINDTVYDFEESGVAGQPA
jgi:hypothetical protein